MKEIRCVIFGHETEYVYALTRFISERKSLPFTADSFTDEQALLSFAKDTQIDVLILSDDGHPVSEDLLSIGRLRFVLGDEMTVVPEGFVLIDRYQSADRLLSRLLETCADLTGRVSEPASPSYQAEPVTQTRQRIQNIHLYKADAMAFPAVSDVRLIGVYSPLGRCGKTSLALALGLRLSGSDPALYLNLEVYSGFSWLTGIQDAGSDLSDLLYFSSLQANDFPFRLSSMTHTMGNLDYICPVFCADDLKESSAEDYRRLLEQISLCADYRYIILDIGTGIGQVFELLNICDLILVPALDDPLSRAKLAQFRENCLSLRGHTLVNALREVSPPQLRDPGAFISAAGRMSAGKLDDYVRRLIESEEVFQDGSAVHKTDADAGPFCRAGRHPDSTAD